MSRWGGYGGFAPYVPVRARLANGRRQVQQLAKKRGRAVQPVVLEGKRKIAVSFWGKAWCDHLESHSDFANRLPRGRAYVRNGSVLDLHIGRGKVAACVAGSELYEVDIALTRLAAPRWQRIIAACAGRIGSLIGLLRGELSADALAVLTDPQAGLFPAPSEIKLSCSCPDGAYMCKHVAAVLYGVGARLDSAPELFFELRQVDQAELLAGANAADVLATAGAKPHAGSGRKHIAASAVASVFGIELDDAAPEKPVLKTPAAKKRGRPASTVIRAEDALSAAKTPEPRAAGVTETPVARSAAKKNPVRRAAGVTETPVARLAAKTRLRHESRPGKAR